MKGSTLVTNHSATPNVTTKVQPTSGALKYHERTHTGDQQFRCSQCDFKCSNKGSLKTHERTHTGDHSVAPSVTTNVQHQAL